MANMYFLFLHKCYVLRHKYEGLTIAQLRCVELQAERIPCSWEISEDAAEANLVKSKRTKMGLVLVADDADDNFLPHAITSQMRLLLATDF